MGVLSTAHYHCLPTAPATRSGHAAMQHTGWALRSLPYTLPALQTGKAQARQTKAQPGRGHQLHSVHTQTRPPNRRGDSRSLQGPTAEKPQQLPGPASLRSYWGRGHQSPVRKRISDLGGPWLRATPGCAPKSLGLWLDHVAWLMALYKNCPVAQGTAGTLLTLSMLFQHRNVPLWGTRATSQRVRHEQSLDLKSLGSVGKPSTILKT